MVRSQREGGHSRKRGYAGGRYADLSKPKYNWTHQHHHKYKYKFTCKYNNKYKNKYDNKYNYKYLQERHHNRVQGDAVPGLPNGPPHLPPQTLQL